MRSNQSLCCVAVRVGDIKLQRCGYVADSLFTSVSAFAVDGEAPCNRDLVEVDGMCEEPVA